MELEPYDFGPIVPDGCCDSSDSFGEVTDGFAPEWPRVRTSYVVLAHRNPPICGCKFRKFTVNLHKDDSWSFTYTNGEELSIEDRNTYCKEIASAQSYLESQERWRKLGRNIGIWDPDNYYGTTGNAGRSDTGTTYYPGQRSDGSYGGGSCSINTPINEIQ